MKFPINYEFRHTAHQSPISYIAKGPRLEPFGHFEVEPLALDTKERKQAVVFKRRATIQGMPRFKAMADP